MLRSAVGVISRSAGDNDGRSRPEIGTNGFRTDGIRHLRIGHRDFYFLTRNDVLCFSYAPGSVGLERIIPFERKNSHETLKKKKIRLQRKSFVKMFDFKLSDSSEF